MMLLADILSSTLLFAIPLLLVALGGMCSERSGIINIALEGVMIIGALISCLILGQLNNAYQTACKMLEAGEGLSGWWALVYRLIHDVPQLAVFAAILAASMLCSDSDVFSATWASNPVTWALIFCSDVSAACLDASALAAYPAALSLLRSADSADCLVCSCI